MKEILEGFVLSAREMVMPYLSLLTGKLRFLQTKGLLKV